MKNNSFIEWPQINFDEIKNYYVENKVARILYKGVILMLFTPQIIISAFLVILKFKA
jgi:hypothetical protein